MKECAFSIGVIEIGIHLVSSGLQISKGKIMSKGSAPRPSQVSDKKVKSEWDRIFNKDKPKAKIGTIIPNQSTK
jgi:hypothetical protein